MNVLLPLVLIGMIIFIGFIGDLIFKKTDIPDIVWLLFFGLLLGPVLNVINPSTFVSVSQLFASIAVIVILFEGGLDLDIYKLFREAPRGLLLTLSAFLFSMLVVIMIFFSMSMIPSMKAIGFTLPLGILVGAIIGGTSSPIVIPIISKFKEVSSKVRTILSIESALTDALSILIAIVVMEAIVSGIGVREVGQVIASGFSIGIVVGSILGIFWLPVLSRLEGEDFSYVLTLSLLFLLYAFVELLSGSGAIACLAFGVILGNGKKVYSMIKMEKLAFQFNKESRKYHALITFIIRTFFFVYLGVLVSFANVGFIVLGVLLGVALFLVRPLAVLVSMKGIVLPDKDKHMMIAMVPRGLAAAVLAYFPLSQGVPHAEIIPDVVFGVILTTVLISVLGVFYVGQSDYDDRGMLRKGIGNKVAAKIEAIVPEKQDVPKSNKRKKRKRVHAKS